MQKKANEKQLGAAITALLIAAILLAALYLYLAIMYPAFRNDDSPETIVSAYTLGISHAPGYPLFNMAAKLFSLLPAGSPAFRGNLFSVLLALAALLIIFLTSRAISGYLRGAALATIVLAFSPFFSAQAISAKGGIYMLNCLLTAVILYCNVRLTRKFDPRFVMLAAYCFGLSLANQWPSALLVSPVWIWMIYMLRREFNGSILLRAGLFTLLGITPYLYLAIRAHTNPVFAMGDPSTFEGFVWIVLRRGYVPANSWIFSASFEKIHLVLKEVIMALSFFWILSGYGLAKLFMQKDPDSVNYGMMLFLPIFGIIVFKTANYSNLAHATKYFIDIFLLPAAMAGAILLATGYREIVAGIKNKFDRRARDMLIISLFIILAWGTISTNDNSRNYLAYDYGRNILSGMENGSIYIADVDANVFPILYNQVIQKIRGDVKMVKLRLLGYDWAIKQAEKELGITGLERRKPGTNTRKIIEKLAPVTPVYASYRLPDAATMKIPYNHAQSGVLLKVLTKKNERPVDPMKLYSYRGIGDRRLMNDPDNFFFSDAYSGAFVNTGNGMYLAGRYAGAARYYKKALLLCGPQDADKINANLKKAQERNAK